MFYKYLFLFAFAFYLCSILFIIFINPVTKIAKFVLGQLILCSIWAFSYFMIFSTNDINQIVLWYRISSIGWCFLPPLSINLTLIIINEKYQNNNYKLFYIILYILPVIFLIKSLTGNLFVKEFDVGINYYREITDVKSVWTYLYILHLISYNILLLFIFLKNIKDIKGTTRKKIFIFFFISIEIPFILVSFTNIILPFLKIYLIPPIGAALIFPFSIMFLYFIFKNEIKVLSPVLKLNDILSNIKEIILILDTNGFVIQFNKRTTYLLGYSELELIGKNINYIFPDFDNFWSLIVNNKQNKNLLTIGEFDFIKKNKEKLPVLVSIGQIYNVIDQFIGIILIAEDQRNIERLRNLLEERNRNIRELKEKENELIKLYLALDQSHDIIVITDEKENIQFVNKKFVEITKYSFDEIIGNKVSIMKSGYHDKNFYKELYNKLTTTGTWEGEFYNKKKDGTYYWEYAKISCIKDNDGNIIGYLKIAEDFTLKKKELEELIKINKLESVQSLLNGLSHEFNNILTIISGNISLLRLFLKDIDNNTLEKLNEVERATFRAKELLLQFLYYTKFQSNYKKTAHIIPLIKDVVKFVLKGSNIQTEFYFTEKEKTILIDTGEIIIAFSNILKNSIESIKENGIIKIYCDEFYNDKNTSYLPLDNGNYLRIIFEDNGEGISEDIIHKVFDPYFTTKENRRGLGLTIAYSIIKNHNGHIEITSEKNKGTRVIVYLPISNNLI